MENWKPVVGYEGLYEVSDLGRVRSVDHLVLKSNGRTQRNRGKIRAQVIVNGYPLVTLSKNGIVTGYGVHRLVMKAFVPVGEKEQVNHIDGNKQNNALSNLEWVTPSENMLFANDIGIGCGKAIVAISPETGDVVHRYVSMRRAENDGYDSGLICLCCNGGAKTHAGLVWKLA